MPTTNTLLAFALVSLGMVLTPGPNMIYLISRSITQGWGAGLVSLGGLALGFGFYMLFALIVTVNCMFARVAGAIAAFLGARPLWILVQRWLMGTVLAGLAVRMALEARR